MDRAVLAGNGQASADRPAALLSLVEVAERLAVAKSTVRALIDREGLPALRVGGVIRIAPGALEDWLEARRMVAVADREPEATEGHEEG